MELVEQQSDAHASCTCERYSATAVINGSGTALLLLLLLLSDVIFREIFREIFQKFHDGPYMAAGCIVHCTKVSKPVKGKICCYA